jgi:hypothetical protein
MAIPEAFDESLARAARPTTPTISSAMASTTTILHLLHCATLTEQERDGLT